MKKIKICTCSKTESAKFWEEFQCDDNCDWNDDEEHAGDITIG